VVIEPEGYSSAPDLYDALGREGVRIMVVPPSYATPLRALGKARALHFAAESRFELGLSNATTWIYHQDEETCVGQDTLLGIAKFVRSNRYLVGSGVILYPIDWAGTPTHVQELTRSYDDFRVLDSMTEPGNLTAGFHGSHIIVRADAEDAAGWDAPGYAPAEDLAFEIRFRARFGSVFGVLSGFAYEKGAYSLADQLRQRRRWVHGVLHALARSHDLPVSRRFTVAYSALSWFSALPSILVLAASLFVHYGPLLLLTGVFTGFVWVSMITAYLEGLRLHTEYVRRTRSIPRLVLHGIVGALVDIAAPWYALVTRPTRNDFIPKERPAASSHPARRAAAD
jgi:beta-1,4-mannosyltransferase